MSAKVKKFKSNGCVKNYKAYAVLMKKDMEGGLFVMRTLTIKDGMVVEQVDTEADLAGVQMGKAIIGLEEVLK